MIHWTYPEENSIWTPQWKEAKDFVLQCIWLQMLIYKHREENPQNFDLKCDEGIFVGCYQQSKA